MHIAATSRDMNRATIVQLYTHLPQKLNSNIQHGAAMVGPQHVGPGKLRQKCTGAGNVVRSGARCALFEMRRRRGGTPPAGHGL